MRVCIEREETRKEVKKYYIDLPDGLTSDKRGDLIRGVIYGLGVNNIVDQYGKTTGDYTDYDYGFDEDDDKFEDDDYDEGDGSDGTTVLFTLDKKGKILHWKEINY